MIHSSMSQGADVRLLEERDVMELYALIDRNRDHLREWLAIGESVKSWMDVMRLVQLSRQQMSANQGGQYVILSEGKLAGMISYHFMGWENRSTTIGYWLGRECTGRGLMTDATRKLCDLAFDRYKLNRVEIRVATGNEKSQAVPERLGFTREGVMRQGEWLHDHYNDLIIYSMLASEWKKS
ncbi:GNAT family N-acetyltransferase [Tumebacillus flagellatus]|uniref:N-acetyltransferase domain-containing protein n=1 Tax=Tumebacillus flagellatus TaxID=1157490 RepID=A0A074LTV7_9BACL|nr:GNAT family protein [Tumebacillus flagellatus]KEO83263.1 hypothetical protein EL26_11270 [Tumebacillus flagellatus]